MEYVDILKEMISLYNSDLENALAGNIQKYCYKEMYDEKWGTSDENYTNRTKLCYALLFDNSADMNKKENLIRFLFEEELKDRETNSFQGIGVNLEMLTSMLKKYNNPDDMKLFERAGNANFDCACGYHEMIFDSAHGYDDSIGYYYSSDFQQYSLIECIYLAQDLNEKEYAVRFTEEWKKDIDNFTVDNYSSLKYFADFNENINDKILAVSKILEIRLADKSSSNYNIFSAYNDYIEQMCRIGKCAEAYNAYIKALPYFKDYERDLCERGAEIMIKDRQYSEKIWRIIKPHIKSMDKKGRLCTALYEQFISCAEMMNKKFADFLKKRLAYYNRNNKINYE